MAPSKWPIFNELIVLDTIMYVPFILTSELLVGGVVRAADF